MVSQKSHDRENRDKRFEKVFRRVFSMTATRAKEAVETVEVSRFFLWMIAKTSPRQLLA